MMIGIFGILKAGAVYLPVNPNDPAKRIEDIVNDANPKYILTTKATSSNLESFYNLVYIEDILNNPLSEDSSNPESGVTARNLAYIIYTSGSTGIPKGVMIEHHSVLNRLLWMQKKYPIGPSDTLMQKTPITFDVSVWELFWWSFTGSKLFILNPNDEKDPDKIIETINKHSVTTIHFVPTMFSAFLEVIKAKENTRLDSLKKIFLSGEALPAKMVNDFNSLENISCPLINLYGPTEATVDVSYYDCPLTPDVTEVFIGKPIDNTQLYVVNSKNKILPVGIPGELIITGVNLSKGYLNREQLNSQKFFTLTLPDNSTVRAYRTGDLCKLTYKGEIEYLGRIDNMVKIRGFRIELGEIETKILEIPEVSNCAVIVYGNCENQSLVAYIQTNNKEFSEKEIKNYLKTKLPEYMVPSFYEVIDIFPLTNSGKLNRKALPEPSIFTKEVAEESPCTNSESEIRIIWEKLLCINNIKTSDNFFDLGGNSLLAIKLSVEINKKFNLSLSPVDIFTYPSIKDISNYIEQKQGANISDSEKRAMQNKQNLLRLRNSRR
jgi:amino acid adenylation domain-containing protein